MSEQDLLRFIIQGRAAMTKIKKAGRSILHALSIIIVIIEIVLILFLVLTKMSGGVPRLFGHSVYVIATPSMTPELEVGDIIISKAYDGGELSVGDVVEYVGKSGEMKGKIITHKIISIDGEGADRTIITKGTANTEADPPIAPSDIISVMKYKTVVIDKIYRVISTTWGFICLVILPMAAMIVSEIVDLARQIKKEKEGGYDDEECDE